MSTGDIVVINGREYPAELYHVALAHEESGGTFCDAVRALRALVEPERPDAGAAVREAIEAARALQPVPRNRHERRRIAALRRRGEML
jgi:hypothetical protein